MGDITTIKDKKYCIGMDLARQGSDKTVCKKTISNPTPKGESIWYQLYKEWVKNK